MKVPFRQVDVFSAVRFKGNPVAVVLRGEDLETAQMQQIARWTNLSETTFVLPPTVEGADYRVRIFTPAAELPFAGHPTIGTAHALLESGLIRPRDGELVQQCGAGRVKLRVTAEAAGERWISFELPRPSLSPLRERQRDELESLLGGALKAGVPPMLVDAGPRWVVAQLPSAQDVLALRPDLPRMKAQDSAHGYTGVVVFGEYAPGTPVAIEVRAFAPACGVDEDPVCGSGNGCVAAFIRHTGQDERLGRAFLSSQGAAMGRAGLLRLTLDGERIWVGGNAVTCVDGTLKI